MCYFESIQGKTVEVGRAHFETETTRFTILDAPVNFFFASYTVLIYIYHSNARS